MLFATPAKGPMCFSLCVFEDVSDYLCATIQCIAVPYNTHTHYALLRYAPVPQCNCRCPGKSVNQVIAGGVAGATHLFEAIHCMRIFSASLNVPVMNAFFLVCSVTFSGSPASGLSCMA